jgi:putative salt-induced outer membrane protein
VREGTAAYITICERAFRRRTGICRHGIGKQTNTIGKGELTRIIVLLLLGLAGAAQAGSMWDSMGLPSATSSDGPPADILSADAKQGFAGTVALGYIGTTGNTNTSSIDANLGLNYTSGNWFHDASFEGQRASTDDETTVNRLDVNGQSNYLFSEHNYLFGRVSYERNDFGGFRRRIAEAFGYGRRILSGGSQTLDFEGGVGARQSHLQDGTARSAGIVRLGGKYEWQFSENGSLGQAVAVEKGSDNTYSESITSLRANVLETLAVIISYTVKHNSDVPSADIANTDTYTNVSLQYSF